MAQATLNLDAAAMKQIRVTLKNRGDESPNAKRNQRSQRNQRGLEGQTMEVMALAEVEMEIRRAVTPTMAPVPMLPPC